MELTETKAIELSKEEVDNIIWADLLEWVNSPGSLSDEIKEEFVKRADQLRLKIQALFLEVQKRVIVEYATSMQIDIEFRKQLREEFPYMTTKDRISAIKVLNDTYDKKLEQLIQQSAGLDLFANIEFAINTLDASKKIPSAITDKVKKLTPSQRRNLSNVINEIQVELDTEELKNSK